MSIYVQLKTYEFMNRQALRRIGNIIITVLTALLTALTTQSCMG